jgi:hypothetical protein
MKLSPPKHITFWISVVVAVLGLLGTFVTIPFVSGFAFWLVVIAFVILAAGNAVEGL